MRRVIAFSAAASFFSFSVSTDAAQFFVRTKIVSVPVNSSAAPQNKNAGVIAREKSNMSCSSARFHLPPRAVVRDFKDADCKECAGADTQKPKANGNSKQMRDNNHNQQTRRLSHLCSTNIYISMLLLCGHLLRARLRPAHPAR
jgi:hypothetical protein